MYCQQYRYFVERDIKKISSRKIETLDLQKVFIKVCYIRFFSLEKLVCNNYLYINDREYKCESFRI